MEFSPRRHRAAKPPAFSDQLSAVGGRLLDERGWHAFDFDGIGGEVFVKENLRKLKARAARR